MGQGIHLIGPASLVRHGLTLFMLCGLLLGGGPVQSTELQLVGYQRQDGAILLHRDGGRVDPYFSSKALLVAGAEGLDIRQTARAWIDWAITQQHGDGRFARICAKDNTYYDCEPADADDAMLAVWIELLTTVSRGAEMPRHWQRSLHNAYSYLMTILHDRQTGLFWISRTQRVSLFMDNMEIYTALRSMADYYLHFGDKDRAQRVGQQAEDLRKRIIERFWLPAENRFRASTQDYDAHGFYPDETAQIVPLLMDFEMPNGNDSNHYAEWMQRNRQAWFEHAATDYPWGLVAIVAAKQHDWQTVSCWLFHAGTYRYGHQWNILEEAVFQGLTARREAMFGAEKNTGCDH